MKGTLERLSAKRQSDDGFTLIELLVVIVILGILAGVVIFAVGGINDKGQDNACTADAKTLKVAEEAYYAEFNAYASEDELVAQEYLEAESTLHNISGVSATTYNVVPVPAGPCN
jgi:prepilin-type N-terminal cleavage/methylation domain-containing protein